MKKLTSILGITIALSLALYSCGNNETASANKQKAIESKPHSAPVTYQEPAPEIPVVPAEVSCRIYFKSDDFTDEETGEFIKGKVAERKDFSKSKAYTFCYDSESFDHLTIKGKGENLTLIVKQGKKVLFKKEQINLVDQLNFTFKQFDFSMGETNTIELFQNDKSVYRGKIDSQGCM